MSKKQVAYKKQQLAASEKYRSRRDLIMALLEEGKTYSLPEVEAVLEKCRKGQVK